MSAFGWLGQFRRPLPRIKPDDALGPPRAVNGPGAIPNHLDPFHIARIDAQQGRATGVSNGYAIDNEERVYAVIDRLHAANHDVVASTIIAAGAAHAHQRRPRQHLIQVGKTGCIGRSGQYLVGPGEDVFRLIGGFLVNRFYGFHHHRVQLFFAPQQYQRGVGHLLLAGLRHCGLNTDIVGQGILGGGKGKPGIGGLPAHLRGHGLAAAVLHLKPHVKAVGGGEVAQLKLPVGRERQLPVEPLARG